jgi:hypothetical protein
MSQLFTILDDKIVINKLAIFHLEGAVKHSGSLSISQGVSIEQNLVVQGRIVADVIEVNQIINKGLGGGSGDTTNFRAESEETLNGQGVTWNVGDTESTLVYRPGNRLYTNLHLDLERGRAYKIDNIEVLTENTLGSSISRSSLRQLGPLNNLIVNGNVEIGQFVYVDSDTGRVGFGTENPNGSFSIVDNGAEFVIASPNVGTVNIGTYSNHDVAITTDNITRVTVKTGGDVHIGNNTSRGAKLVVHGTIQADNIITETKLERTDSVKFLATDGSVFGIGLQWVGSGSPKQLILRPNPDRIWSSEHIELATNRSLMINDQVVLNSTTLGASITESSLTSLGNLSSITVSGNTALLGSTSAQSIHANEINFGEGSQLVKVNDRGLSASLSFNLLVGEQNVIYADSGSVTIGSSENTRRQIRTFGTLSVNVNNPDPELQFAVAGNIGFAGRKFITGTSAPEQGNYAVGDICWNNAPQIGGHVGWICCSAGAPGMWFKFGMIS